MTKRKFDMSGAFKRDLKKFYLDLVGEAWTEVSNCLLNDVAMSEKYRNHLLHGDLLC